MELKAWIAVALFAVTILSIARGWMKASTATLLGASAMMLFRLVPGSAASQYIDSNTVGLLVGMMIVVGILSKTGLFQYIAVKAIKVTKGNGILILLSISLITAVLSAFLDNVTTVLLVSPVVVSLADLIKMNPLPLLMSEVIASNIGGTATLIGDPPNMIVGSYAGFSFNDFLLHLSPVVTVVWVISMVFLCLHYRKDLNPDPAATNRLKEVDESKLIKDKKLMVRAGFVMFMVLLGFLFHHHLGLNASVVALFAAGVLLATSHLDDGEIVHQEVEWPTIVYFVSLFILVGGLQENGVILSLAEILTDLLSYSPMAMILGILWISGLSCVFINNVAFSAMFVHVVSEMAKSAGMPPDPLFWSLALGSCLGGNGSYLGAAANAVMADFAGRSGFRISFGSFFVVGIKTVLISLAVASVFLFVTYRNVATY
ncbi:Citrate transporter [Dethiosulfovibrio peptidovorans DSM 11002]|uniref:Citrate transporter n=1 Tax=Dethiosulfovibrio peptidovorans DSM 11002 TaxID=469381 RepID=D2Z842_9BACT|nr:ArsB/NhaD family transporter [Dethiosulfovibrio peptidovorans]EFC91639.1 Citrate transporter [Dethiosulfovibrio peptidovorans DSM 11002]